MKMPAGIPVRRAAGMEYGNAFGRREGGQLQFLEHGRRDDRNFRPVLDGAGHQFPAGANFPVSGIGFELEGEQFEGERIEISFILEGRVPQAPILTVKVRNSRNFPLPCDDLAQARGKV